MSRCILLSLLLLGCRAKPAMEPVVVATLLYEAPAGLFLGNGDKLPDPAAELEPILKAQRDLLASEAFWKRAGADLARRDSVTIEIVKDSRLIRLDFHDRDEARAKTLCRALLDGYVRDPRRVRVVDDCRPAVLIRKRR